MAARVVARWRTLAARDGNGVALTSSPRAVCSICIPIDLCRMASRLQGISDSIPACPRKIYAFNNAVERENLYTNDT
ncbi:hypothetical protein EVAR_3570_1 [Eumeta japonica]|uniref:Uncharacterized protein n=1 Tax=Eumeta variegata TaxID=151549 RepID=A0A4C1SWA1_EUMVA|nr:hypothetical protein EVAR_3570_1 [Eumeta japonica]